MQGGYRACSRLGIDCSRSPFLKISFETAAAFLTDATLHGASDDLASPASRIVLGRVVEVRPHCANNPKPWLRFRFECFAFPGH